MEADGSFRGSGGGSHERLHLRPLKMQIMHRICATRFGANNVNGNRCALHTCLVKFLPLAVLLR